MDIPQQVAHTLQRLLTVDADGLGRESGFIRRQSKISAASFCAGVVLTWLGQADARLYQLAAGVVARGKAVTTQALALRFTAAAATLLHWLLERAVQELLCSAPVPWRVLRRFVAVEVYDCTTLALPAAFAEQWPGCGGGQSPTDGLAALKVSVGWDLVCGGLCHLSLHPGRTHDRATLPPLSSRPRGTLRLTDLGYFALPALAELSGAGQFWLTRLQAGTWVWYRGHGASQAEFLAQRGPCRADATKRWQVELGKHARVPAWLVVQRVPDEVAALRRERLEAEARERGQPVSRERLELAAWTVLVTNVPPRKLSNDEALALYRVRWQIELLFKVWKGQGGLGESRSRQPYRILCEQYAKLLALVVLHWLMLVEPWREGAFSWQKAARVVRGVGCGLLYLLDDVEKMAECLARVAESLRCVCVVDPRRKRPGAFQRLNPEGCRA